MVDQIYSVGISLDSRDFNRGLDEVQRRFNRFEREARSFSRGVGGMDDAFKQANRSLGAFETALVSGFGSAIGTAAIQGLTSAFQTAQRAIVATGRAVISFTAEGTNLAATYQRTEATISQVVDSTTDANQAFSFFVETTERLGFSQSQLSNSYIQLLSSAEAAGLGVSETNAIFGAFAENARLFGLSTDDIEGAIRQIGQTLGNENAQWEELGIVLERSVASQALLRDALGLTQEEFSNMRRNGTLPATESILALADALSGRAAGALGPALEGVEGQTARFGTEVEKFQRNLGGAFLPIRTEIARIGADIVAKLNEENDLFDQLERVAEEFAEELAGNPELIDEAATELGRLVKGMGDLVASSAEFATNLTGALRTISDLTLGARRAFSAFLGTEGVFDAEAAGRAQNLSSRQIADLRRQIEAQVSEEQTVLGRAPGRLSAPFVQEVERRLEDAIQNALVERQRRTNLDEAFSSFSSIIPEAQPQEEREEAERAVGATRSDIQSKIAAKREEDAQAQFAREVDQAQKLAEQQQRDLEQETQEELSAVRELFDIESEQSRRLHELNLGYIELELGARLRGLGSVEREATRQSNDLIRALAEIESRSQQANQNLESALFGLSQAQQFNQLVGGGTTVPVGGGGGGGAGSFVGFSGASGIGTGAHLDIRLRGGGRRLTDEELSRFNVGGQSLLNFPITSEFGPRRAPVAGASTFHQGVDFGIGAGQRIETTVPIASVNLRDPSQTGGGGWVTDVVFEDGLEVSLLHLDPSTANAQLGGGRPRTPTTTGRATPGGSQATSFIAGFEGFSPTAYHDRTQFTYGYGTRAPGAGATISEEEAQQILGHEVERFAQGVQDLVTTQLNQNQLDALTSFAFNVGLGAFAESTLLQQLNSGNVEAAADELLRWTRSGDSELQGLVSRREAERELFLTPSDQAATVGGGSAYAGPNLQDTRALQANAAALEEYNRQQQELFNAQRTAAIADYFDSLNQGYRDEVESIEQSLELRRLELSLRDETPEFAQRSIAAYEEERALVEQLGAQLNQLNRLRDDGAITAEQFAEANDQLAQSAAALREARAESLALAEVEEALAREAERTQTLDSLYRDQADILAELRLRITALTEGRSELSAAEERHLELQRLGINLTAEEAAALREQDAAIAELTQQQEALLEAQQAVESFEQTLIGSFSNAAVEVFSFSEDIGTTIGNLAESILSSLASLAFNSIFSSLFGGALGGAGGALGNVFLGSFQEGGVINRRGLAEVGEAGPEAIVPLSGGRSIPVDLRGSGDSSPPVTVNVTVNNGTGQTSISGGQGTELGLAIQSVVLQTLRNEQRHGGILSPRG